MWKEEDGTKYKISYSEELQLKNLRATREQTRWQKANFFMGTVVVIVLVLLIAVVAYTLFRLDAIDFFTRVAYR